MKTTGTKKTNRAFIGALIVTCLVGYGRQPESSGQVEKAEALLDYIEVLTGEAKTEETLPMVAVVHGLGDRPESFTPFLDVLEEKTRVILPRAPTPWGGGHAWFDKSRDGNWEQLSDGMASSAKRLAHLLSHLAKTRPTKGLPIIVGFSQGGMLSYAVASNYPRTIRLAVPISGLLPRPLWLAAKDVSISYPRIRALHGTVDRIVPITYARDTVSHLKKIGLDVTLEEYPMVSHTISYAMRKKVLDLVRQELRK